MYSSTDRSTVPEDVVKIRHLRAEDIPAIQAIDRNITNRATTWDNVDIYLAGKRLLSFVAEKQSEVVGFLLGDVRSYEFGIPQSAWIETMGVDSRYQREGIGGMLVRTFVEHCQRSGIKTVQALVKRDDGDLHHFLKAIGFAEGDKVNFEKTL